MKYDSWLHQVSMLSETDKAVLAASSDALKDQWQSNIAPLEAARRLNRSRFRLKKTFQAGELIGLAELSNVLGVEAPDLLAATVGRTSIAGAVPPRSIVVGRDYYFQVEDVHRVYGDVIN